MQKNSNISIQDNLWLTCLPVFRLTAGVDGLIVETSVSEGLGLAEIREWPGMSVYKAIPDEFFSKLFSQALQMQKYTKGILTIGKRYFETSFIPQVNQEGSIDSIQIVGLEITEQLNNKQKLINAEVKLNNLTNNLPGLVMSYCIRQNLEHQILFCSQGAEEIFGLTSFELKSNILNFWSCLSEPDLSQFKQQLNHSAQNNSPLKVEFALANINAKVKWVKVHGAPQELNNGAFVWDMIVLDISEEKEKEEKIKQSYNELKLIDSINISSINHASAQEIATLSLKSFNDLIPLTSGRFCSYNLNDELFYVLEEYNKQPKNPETLTWPFHFDDLKSIGLYNDGEELNNIKVFHDKLIQKILVLAGSKYSKNAVASWLAALQSVKSLILIPLTHQQKLCGIILLASSKTINTTELKVIKKFGTQIGAALSKSLFEHQYKQVSSIVESSDLGIITLNLNQQIATWNQGARVIFGYTTAEVIDQDIAMLMPDDTLGNVFLKSIVLAKQGHTTKNLFVQQQTKTKSLVDLEVTVAPLFDAHKGLMGVSMVMCNVTDRSEALNQLTESENRLSSVLSIIGEGVWDWQVDKNRIWNNERWCTLLELDEVILEHDIDFIKQIVHPDDVDGLNEKINACFEGESSFFSRHRLITPKGNLKWVEDRGQVVSWDKNKRPLRITGSLKDITETVTSEMKLTETSDLLKNLTNQVPGMLYQFKLAANGAISFPYSSEGIKEIYELNPEDVREDASIGLKNIYADDLDLVLQSIQKSAQELSNWELEYRVNLPKKGIKWRYGLAKPERLPDGSTLWHGYITDITEKKRIQLEKEQFYQFFQTSNDMMAIANENGILTNVNAAFVKKLGYSEEEFLAQSFINLIHPDELRYTKYQFFTKLVQDSEVKFDNRVLTKSGEYKWVSWAFFKNKDEQHLYAYAIDITDKKQTENALIESEKNLQAIFELTPVPLVITKLYDGEVIMANEATELMFGYKSDEVVGKHGVDLFMDGEDQIKFTEELKKKGKVNLVEVTLKTKSNQAITCLVSSEIIYMNGEIALLSSMLDISDRKKFELELVRKNNELKKANVELDRFVYSTSHDLRAPLLSVLGLVDICEGYKPVNEELQGIYKMMRTSINRSDETIKSILDYSRNARIEPTPEVLDVNAIIHNHIEQIKHMREALQIKFEVNVQQTGEFCTDKMRFTTIVNNLITNAVKYQRVNEVNQSIKIDFTFTADTGCLVVTDNGEGIPNDKIDKLFGMFVRLSTKSAGSGLGLYMCKEMVEKMGGLIEVTSEVNVGSSFKVIIPNNSINHA